MTNTEIIQGRFSCEDFSLKSELPVEQIAISYTDLFFNKEADEKEWAEAIRQVLKEKGKRYFTIAKWSSYAGEDMLQIITSGLGKVAGQALVYYAGCCGEKLVGAAAVFELI